MEENKELQYTEEENPEQDCPQIETQSPHYHPRPKWQIAAAWVGLAIVIVGVALYYYHIATAGL